MIDDYDDDRQIDRDDELRRKKHEAPIGALAADIIGAIPQLTDAEWEERDRQAAAVMERVREVDARSQARPDLERFGWLARTLKNARSAGRARVDAELMAHDFGAKNIVVLSGPKGVGKTVAAALWALRRPRPTYMLTAARFARTSRYSAEQREEWFSAPALVLDDLGVEYVDEKGSFLADLDELIDVYYASERPLIITTNCTDKVFLERYKARVFDRIIEAAEWISVVGESMRGQP